MALVWYVPDGHRSHATAPALPRYCVTSPGAAGRATCPNEHEAQLVAPAELNVAFGQLKQTPAPELYVPATQTPQPKTEPLSTAPSPGPQPSGGHALVGSHCTHLTRVIPSLIVPSYAPASPAARKVVVVPAAHGTHAPPASECNPAAHRAHAPFVGALPALHATHEHLPMTPHPKPPLGSATSSE